VAFVREPKLVKRPESRFSVRVEPFWLNPATIKGSILILAGLVILAFPEASIFLIRIVIGVALVGSGFSDLWFHVLLGQTSNRGRDAIEGLLATAAGVVFLLYPSETLRSVTLLTAIYLAARGVTVVISVVRQRGDTPRLANAVRGASLIVFALVLVLLPETVVASLVVAFAVVAIVLGGVVLAYGIQRHSEDEIADVDAASVSEIARDWMLFQDVGDARRAEIDDSLYFEQPDRTNKLVAWWVMLLLSVTIATFGILADSTAVVIGAMLIAPLMTPIIGAAAATATDRRSRLVSSFILIAAGVSAAIGLAYVIGAWAPAIVPLDKNTQVLSRVSPNLIDMGIALAAGAAGAFANVNKRVSASIAGVAIAVALVPPLGVVGLTLQAGMYSDTLGALLLFVTNLVSIILAAVTVFYLTGFAPIKRATKHSEEITSMFITIAIVAMVIMVPLVFTVEGVLATASRQSTAQQVADEWLKDDGTLHVVSVNTEGTEVNILVGGEGDLPPVEDLGKALSEGFDEPATVIVEYAPTVIVSYSYAGP
jgi:uncharacterized hydrophobic protein (TIGR00271 family)